MIPQPPPPRRDGPALRGPLAPAEPPSPAAAARAYRVMQAREWTGALVGVGLLLCGLAMISRDLIGGLGVVYGVAGLVFAAAGGYRTYYLARYLTRRP